MDRRAHHADHSGGASLFLAAKFDLPALRPPGYPEGQQLKPDFTALSAFRKAMFFDWRQPQ